MKCVSVLSQHTFVLLVNVSPLVLESVVESKGEQLVLGTCELVLAVDVEEDDGLWLQPMEPLTTSDAAAAAAETLAEAAASLSFK